MILTFAVSSVTGVFRPDTRMFSLHRHLEDFGCFTSTRSTVGWTCVSATCSTIRWWILSRDKLQLVLCVLNLLRDFRNSAGLLHHLWFLHVDDLFNDSFRDSLQWNAVNNLNELLHRTILHASLASVSLSFRSTCTILLFHFVVLILFVVIL